MRQVTTMTVTTMIALAVGTLWSGCGNGRTESRSMEQIYAEDGVPVRVETVAPASFAVSNEYNAELTGVEESSAFALVSDRVDEVNVKVGDRVAKDSVILTFPTDNPSARFFQAKVAFENAKSTFDRMTGYYESGGLSQQDYDNARASYRVAEADWNAAQQTVLVRAPIAGVVTKVNVRPSDNVDKEDELFTISQTGRMKARLWVPEKEISAYAVGQQATAQWSNITLSGHVVQVDRAINLAHQAFGVTVEFDNPKELQLCGVIARVKVVSYARPDAVVIERKNVSHDDAGSYVYLAHGDRAEKRYVTLGPSSELDIQVQSGLAAGDTLVTDGQLNLSDGTLIRVIGTMAEAPAAE